MGDSAALHNYFMLRGALARHQKLPWQLSEAERTALAQSVSREKQLVARALSSSSSRAVEAEGSALQSAVESFIAELQSLDDAELLLREAGLHHASLSAAMGDEMQAAALLERLTAAVAPTEQEVFQWYVAHPGKFQVPERREVYQILITVNDLYAENQRDAARKRIDEVARRAHAAPASFGELAQAHSECPSAVEGGRLGVVPPGHLYPQLDQELFALESGALSRVVESPLGFHLLRCGVIEPSRRLDWEEVRESLSCKLTELARKRFLQQWLAGGKA